MFPQYRKLNNNKSYYKISSNSEFTEIGTMGNFWWENNMSAKILPERVMIQDMIDGLDGTYIEINELEYTEFLNICTLQKQKREV